MPPTLHWIFRLATPCAAPFKSTRNDFRSSAMSSLLHKLILFSFRLQPNCNDIEILVRLFWGYRSSQWSRCLLLMSRTYKRCTLWPRIFHHKKMPRTRLKTTTTEENVESLKNELGETATWHYLTCALANKLQTISWNICGSFTFSVFWIISWNQKMKQLSQTCLAWKPHSFEVNAYGLVKVQAKAILAEIRKQSA